MVYYILYIIYYTLYIIVRPSVCSASISACCHVLRKAKCVVEPTMLLVADLARHFGSCWTQPPAMYRLPQQDVPAWDMNPRGRSATFVRRESACTQIRRARYHSTYGCHSPVLRPHNSPSYHSQLGTSSRQDVTTAATPPLQPRQ